MRPSIRAPEPATTVTSSTSAASASARARSSHPLPRPRPPMNELRRADAEARERALDPQRRALTAGALRHGTTRGWNLAHDPGALRIQTIDSFTYWLASQLPIAARAGGTLRVTGTPQELYRRAARRTLLAAEADAVLGADTELLFERLDNHWNNVERLLADM